MNNEVPWRIELYPILLIFPPCPVSEWDSHQAGSLWCQPLSRHAKHIDVLAHMFKRMMKHNQIPILRCSVLQIDPADICSFGFAKGIDSVRVIAKATKDIDKLSATASHIQDPGAGFWFGFHYGLKCFGRGPEQSNEIR